MNIRTLSAYSLAATLTVFASSSLSAAIEPAKPISQVAPAYSSDLRVSGVEGEVVVSFTITTAGDVRNPVVVSSTDKLLESPTLAAVRKWKFAPATNNGVAISVKATQPVAFLIPELHSDVRLVTSNSKAAPRAGRRPESDRRPPRATDRASGPKLGGCVFVIYCQSPADRQMPMAPTRIQKPFKRMYAESRLSTAQRVRITASIVLKIQTNMKGLFGPSQLTSEKLKIRMMTPIISNIFIFART